MRVLIVEDELKIRTGMAKLILSHTDHEVVGEAKNGKEALNMVQRFHPQLIISDIRMPVMDGLELMEELQRQEIHCHFVVLSGYSDFEYARRAMRYGAEDYLLKPLAPEDVIALLDKVQKIVAKEEAQQMETAEGILRDLYLDGNDIPDEKLAILQKSDAYDPDKEYKLLVGYLGNTGTEYVGKIQKFLKEKKAESPKEKLNYAVLEQTQEIVCLMQTEESEEALIESLEKLFYRHVKDEEQPLWSLLRIHTLREIGRAKDRIKELQRYGLVLGYRRILTELIVQEYVPEHYEYPRAFEGELQSGICSNTTEKLQRTAEKIVSQMRMVRWEPKNITKTYRNLLHFAENLIQETSSELYQVIEKLDVQKRLHEVITLGETEEVFRMFVQAVVDGREKKEDIHNYTILRAINFIKDHYAENISLEQLAEQLEITPEYLSSLFNREVGINFSVFLKRFRISHAKRLLKSTDYKIYEIASMVGYRDPKYFNRVFKEEVGVSPGDFRS